MLIDARGAQWRGISVNGLGFAGALMVAGRGTRGAAPRGPRVPRIGALKSS
jgi:hypothetical protein